MGYDAKRGGGRPLLEGINRISISDKFVNYLISLVHLQTLPVIETGNPEKLRGRHQKHPRHRPGHSARLPTP